MLLKEFQGMDRTAEIDNETGNKDEQLNFEENNSPGEDNELDNKSFEHILVRIQMKNARLRGQGVPNKQRTTLTTKSKPNGFIYQNHLKI